MRKGVLHHRAFPGVGRLSESVTRVLSTEPVRFAYLFGSHAWGHPDRESDIDIAVYADPALTKEQRWDLRMKLLGSISAALHLPIDRIDLVVLQDSPPLLQWNIARTGVCVFERSASERNLAVLRIEQAYDDEKPHIRMEGEDTLRKILTQPLL
ncbi:MAG: nucleotidyltransferase domain-containing protein [Patescibacteria group bacterium]